MYLKTVLAVAIAATLSMAASAADAAEVRVSGFGQIVGGAMMDRGDEYPEREYGHRLDFQPESTFGVQIDAELNDRVTATGQVLAKGSDDFNAELAWAYAKVRVVDGLDVKVGRQRLPLYRFSDYLDVGYAYPWVRTPVAMYNQPWSNVDGISATYNLTLGPVYLQSQAIYGNFDDQVRLDGRNLAAKLDRISGLSIDAEYDEWLSVRAAYLRANVTITGSSIDQLVPVLRNFGQAARAEAVDYSADLGEFKSIGFKAEKFNVLAVGEYSETSIEDSAFDNTDRTDCYASVGYKIGSVMPHFTYGRRSQDQNEAIIAGVPTASPLYGPLLMAANSQVREDEFKSIGVRWDFADNVAFKADYSRYEDRLTAEKVDGDVVSAAIAFTF